MKKIKIMLTAITVLAIVGGALAFKVKGTGFGLYTCVNNACELSDADNTYTTVGTGLQTWASATITNIVPAGTCGASAGKCHTTTTGKVEPK
jgi:hypothetical protein